MADLIHVAIIIAFTTICIAYIGWCDRIIGHDEPDAAADDAAAPTVKDAVTL